MSYNIKDTIYMVACNHVRSSKLDRNSILDEKDCVKIAMKFIDRLYEKKYNRFFDVIKDIDFYRRSGKTKSFYRLVRLLDRLNEVVYSKYGIGMVDAYKKSGECYVVGAYDIGKFKSVVEVYEQSNGLSDGWNYDVVNMIGFVWGSAKCKYNKIFDDIYEEFVNAPLDKGGCGWCKSKTGCGHMSEVGITIFLANMIARDNSFAVELKEILDDDNSKINQIIDAAYNQCCEVRKILKQEFDKQMENLKDNEEESKSSSFCKCKSCEHRPPCTPCSKVESVCSGKTDESDIEDDEPRVTFP